MVLGNPRMKPFPLSASRSCCASSFVSTNSMLSPTLTRHQGAVPSNLPLTFIFDMLQFGRVKGIPPYIKNGSCSKVIRGVGCGLFSEANLCAEAMITSSTTNWTPYLTGHNQYLVISEDCQQRLTLTTQDQLVPWRAISDRGCNTNSRNSKCDRGLAVHSALGWWRSWRKRQMALRNSREAFATRQEWMLGFRRKFYSTRELLVQSEWNDKECEYK